MPDNDQTNRRPGGSGEDQPRVSRRSVLGAAGVGAAGLAAGALATGAPALASARTPAAGAAGRDARGRRPAAGEPVVVHLKDARTGEFDVYRGTSHIRVHDRDLAARLMRTIR
jgi:hypothetical protein